MKKKTINTNKSDILDLLQRKNKPHTVVFTNNSTTVETENTKYLITSDILPNSIFSLINKIKSVIDKDVMPKEINKTRYFLFNRERIKQHKKGNDIIELDINAAYYTAARNLGYIDENGHSEVENLISKLKLEKKYIKKAKLIALGSFATKKEKYIYNQDTKKYDFLGIDEKNTENIFFHISQEVDRLMIVLSKELKDDFLFYWVDAIFVKKDAEQKVFDFFNNNNYLCSKKNIKSYKTEIFKNGIVINLTEVKAESEIQTDIRIKKFFCPFYDKTTNDIKKKHFDLINKINLKNGKN